MAAPIKPKVLLTDIRDPTILAIELTAIKGEFALLSSQVSQGIGNLVSQISSLQGEYREHGRILRGVEAAQHDMQQHSMGLNRLADVMENRADEFNAWRKSHEVANQIVADRINSFRGAIMGFGLLGATVLAIGLLWLNAEFANVRREATDKYESLAQARLQIVTKHDQDTTALKESINNLNSRPK